MENKTNKKIIFVCVAIVTIMVLVTTGMYFLQKSRPRPLSPDSTYSQEKQRRKETVSSSFPQILPAEETAKDETQSRTIPDRRISKLDQYIEDSSNRSGFSVVTSSFNGKYQTEINAGSKKLIIPTNGDILLVSAQSTTTIFSPSFRVGNVDFVEADSQEQRILAFYKVDDGDSSGSAYSGGTFKLVLVDLTKGTAVELREIEVKKDLPKYSSYNLSRVKWAPNGHIYLLAGKAESWLWLPYFIDENDGWKIHPLSDDKTLYVSLLTKNDTCSFVEHYEFWACPESGEQGIEYDFYSIVSSYTDSRVSFYDPSQGAGIILAEGEGLHFKVLGWSDDNNVLFFDEYAVKQYEMPTYCESNNLSDEEFGKLCRRRDPNFTYKRTLGYVLSEKKIYNFNSPDRAYEWVVSRGGVVSP